MKIEIDSKKIMEQLLIEQKEQIKRWKRIYEGGAELEENRLFYWILLNLLYSESQTMKIKIERSDIDRYDVWIGSPFGPKYCPKYQRGEALYGLMKRMHEIFDNMENFNVVKDGNFNFTVYYH